MAHIPTKKEVALVQRAAKQEVEEKTADQRAQGKDFVHDPYGPGVIPEKDWQKMKVDPEKEMA